MEEIKEYSSVAKEKVPHCPKNKALWHFFYVITRIEKNNLNLRVI